MATTLAQAREGIAFYSVERGGDVTYHGPGQLVGYPILDLKNYKQDVHWLVERLEEVLIRTLAAFGVASGRRSKYPGVWVENDKIASIGLAVRFHNQLILFFSPYCQWMV